MGPFFYHGCGNLVAEICRFDCLQFVFIQALCEMSLIFPFSSSTQNPIQTEIGSILTTRNRKMLRLAFSLQNYENTTGIPRGIVEDGMVIVVDGTVTRITMKIMEEVAETNGGPMNLDLPTRVMATATIMDGIILAVMAVAVTVVVVVMGEEVIGTTLCPSKDVLGLMIDPGTQK